MSEETLADGNTVGAVRMGNVVHKQASPWTPTVHALLRHLEDAGFDGAPGAIGFDDQGGAAIALLPVAGYIEQSASDVESFPHDFWVR